MPSTRIPGLAPAWSTCCPRDSPGAPRRRAWLTFAESSSARQTDVISNGRCLARRFRRRKSAGSAPPGSATFATGAHRSSRRGATSFCWEAAFAPHTSRRRSPIRRQRLPIHARDASQKHAPLVKLTSQPQRPPIAVATQATLDTIAADGALASASSDTPSRISQYREWLSGTSATGVEQGMQAFRQQCASAHRTLPGHSSTVSLTDVKNVVHLESLRLALSKAIPQVKPTIRTFLVNQLERTGIRSANPDQIYVQADARGLMSIVDVVLNATAYPGTPSHLSMPILAKGPDGAFRTFRKSKSTTGNRRRFRHAGKRSRSTGGIDATCRVWRDVHRDAPPSHRCRRSTFRDTIDGGLHDARRVTGSQHGGGPSATACRAQRPGRRPRRLERRPDRTDCRHVR